MYKTRNIGIILLLFLIGCGGPPAVSLYMLHFEDIFPESSPESIKIGIYPISINPIYSNYGIAYQQTPYQIQFYHYHQWASNPANLVSQSIVDYLKQSNKFSYVAQLPSTKNVDIAIKGNILKFIEWNEENQWYGWIEIDFQIFQANNDKLIWQGEISKKVPALQRNPISVVKALSNATQQVAEELTEKILGNKI